MFAGRQRVHLYAGIVALAVAASASSLGNRFAFDDVALVSDNTRVHSLAHWWTLFARPYWPPQFGASLYRPAVTVGYALQWVTGGGAPWLFHATSVGLYAAACALVLDLFLLLLPATGAFIGAALFAVHPVHVEAVGNVVGQSELIAALAMLSACVVYVRRRRTGRLGAQAIAGIVALFATACLAKEHALLLPGLLIALEACAVERATASQRRSWRAQGREIMTLYVGLAVVGVAYLAARTAVIGNVLGEQHLVPMHGLTRVWTMLVVAPHWARLLFWPARLSSEYSPLHIAIPSGPGIEIVPGIVVLVAAALSLVALSRLSRHGTAEPNAALLGVAWTGIALLPVTNLFSVMIVAERTLFVSSIGAMLVVGAGMSGALNAVSDRRGRIMAKRLLAATATVLVVLGTVRSSARQRVWRDDATLFPQMVVDAPLSYRAQYFYGQLLFAQGRRSEGERRLRLAIELNPTPSDVSPLNYLATQYREAGMCPQALPLYERALANDAARPDVRFGLASCLLATGRVADARRLADDGLRRGDLSPLFAQLLGRADSVAAQEDGADGDRAPQPAGATSPPSSNGSTRARHGLPPTAGRPAIRR